MKKIIMMLVSGVVGTALVTNNATAQTETDVSYANRKITASSATAVNSNTGTITAAENEAKVKALESNLKAAKINLKINNHVTSNFSNVSELSFHNEQNLTIAQFKMGQKSSRVVYDEKGNWMYSITTYYQDQLPTNIRSLVNRSYGKYNITLVQEVSQGDVNLHKIHLEDATTIKHILVCNDEITEYADFDKSR